MTSIREQILAKMVTVLNAGAIGAQVYRSRTDPISRAQSPAVIIQPVSDTAKQVSIPYLDCELLTHVTVYVRGAAPDTLADPMLVAINSALLADQTLGGLVMLIMPMSTHFEFSDSDTELCVATCEYKIDYRTNQRDLTQ